MFLTGAHFSAEALNCGDTISHGEKVILTSNLTCPGALALTVIGPAILDLDGHTVECQTGSDCIIIQGKSAKVLNGAVKNNVVVEGIGRHQLKNLITGSFVVNSNTNFIENNTVVPGLGNDRTQLSI